ncbi:MAG: oligoribonuclease [Acidimicrobiaceae bacterium]|nr:oligoribonuclease [Acidimicrobiaceae bacterium]MBC83904.1 oligoribonuclease [Acidimicrobiaceae bacterium]|tara:strand:+ start:542 stop:1090 length:549 start_codon:yes stop_codon:yes gene_type:complete
MLAWIDLEMTGLDPDENVVVEIATLITNNELEIIAEGPDLVIHATEEDLAKMDSFVVDMHTKSGLLPEIRNSNISVEEAEKQTMAFLNEHIKKEKSVPLCGNSIGTDRRFLAKYLPNIENFLHYRSVDVSSIKELVKRWFPEILEEAPKKNGGHRAMEDIKASVEELRFYRTKVFSKDKDSL